MKSHTVIQTANKNYEKKYERKRLESQNEVYKWKHEHSTNKTKILSERKTIMPRTETLVQS